MGDDPCMDGDPVPREFVEAGAPASVADWTDEQRDGYFRGEAGELIEGDAPIRLEVEPIREWPVDDW
jgi:hypothetical protein